MCTKNNKLHLPIDKVGEQAYNNNKIKNENR